MLLSLLQRIRRTRRYSLPTVALPVPRYQIKTQVPKCFDVCHGILIVTPLDRMLVSYMDVVFQKK
jgi:hypothetical protein